MAEMKQVELAKLKMEERAAFQSELTKQKADFEAKLLEAKASFLKSLEDEQRRFENRERDLDHQNMELRQKLFEETNRIVFAEKNMRNEAELKAKELNMEKELLQRRFDQVTSQLDEMQGFRDKYTQKMEDAMAQ